MMSKMRAFAVGFGLLVATSHAQSENIFVIGAGKLSCGLWVEARTQGNTHQQNLGVQWVAGYLAGHNYYKTQRVKQASVEDLPTIELWLDTYCRNNPTHTTFAAAVALVEELGGIKALHPWKR